MTSVLQFHGSELQRFFNIEDNQHGMEILSANGLSLQELSMKYESRSIISSLTCVDFIAKIDTLFNKEIKFTGQGREALLNAFSFILLAIGCKQNKYYPHLISIIKEQFFKPGVFNEYENGKRNRVFNTIRNIQIQLINSGSVSDFLINNEEFLEGFHHVLNKILLTFQETHSYGEIVEILRKRFNIDCNKIDIGNSHALCWVLGMQKKIYLFQEQQSFIVVSASTSTQPNKSMNESAIQNRMQSQRSVEQPGQQIIMEAVTLRKVLQNLNKTNNLFGTEEKAIRIVLVGIFKLLAIDVLAIFSLELVNLVNKSQQDAMTENKESNVKKLFSVKFEMQEMGCLTMEQELPIHKDLEGENVNRENNLNIAKNQIQMRGSNIQGNQNRRGEKGDRKKHITSSEIFNLMNKNGGVQKKKGVSRESEKLQEDNPQNGAKNEANQQLMECSLKNIQGTASENCIEGHEDENKKMGNGVGVFNVNNFSALNAMMGGTHKQHFKFSFSKKDASRFVFKEIQSEYNDNDNQYDLEIDPELDNSTEMKIDRFLKNGGIKIQQSLLNSGHGHNAPLRSSLTNPKSGVNSGFLTDSDYFKKRDKNRRSLLLQATINTIQQEVQSSQRDQTEEQSITQSQRQIQNSQQQQQLQRKSNTSYNNNNNNNTIFGNVNNQWNYPENKNYINIFKSKNRKFSYLTQPMSTSKNSLFNGNPEQLRQSYMDNQTIPQSPQNDTNRPSFFQNNRTFKNRISKSPKKFHKHSQAVTQSKPQKRRFEQNPISFSQMINLKDDQNFSSKPQPNKKPVQLLLSPNVLQFIKDNTMCYNQPEGWIRKQVVYYFGNTSGYLCDGNKRKPQRYIIDRTPPEIFQQSLQIPQINSIQQVQSQQNKQSSGSCLNSHPNNTDSSNCNANQTNKQKEASVAMSNENKPNSVPNTKNQQNNVVYQPSNVCVPAVNVTNNNLVTVQKSNKIRSTIDTANAPSGTYLNLSTKNIRNLYNNLPTPPSSLSNLPSDSNPEQKQQQVYKNKSVKQQNNDFNKSLKQKVKHKQYKDLQNLHLNLRKKKSNKESPQKNNKDHNFSYDKHQYLNITYPSQINYNSSTTNRYQTSLMPVSIIAPSLSLDDLRNKKSPQKLQRERQCIQKQKTKQGKFKNRVNYHSANKFIIPRRDNMRGAKQDKNVVNSSKNPHPNKIFQTYSRIANHQPLFNSKCQDKGKSNVKVSPNRAQTTNFPVSVYQPQINKKLSVSHSAKATKIQSPLNNYQHIIKTQYTPMLYHSTSFQDRQPNVLGTNIQIKG